LLKNSDYSIKISLENLSYNQEQNNQKKLYAIHTCFNKFELDTNFFNKCVQMNNTNRNSTNNNDNGLKKLFSYDSLSMIVNDVTIA
jgi:hypothetical protein